MIERYQKFLLFPFVFFLVIFLFLLKPQTIFSWYYCNNGPNNNDGGGCGTPCHCGQPWTQYIKDNYGSEFCEFVGTTKLYVKMVSELCPTGDVCILGEYGLRYGTCDCLFGSIYKMCCVGSTPVKCIRYGDPKWKRGTCPSGSTIVRGTSCPSVETHRVCSGSSCVTVSGAGSNQCNSNSDCVTATHRVCSGSSCVTVSGAGSNQCNSNSDCGGGGPTPTPVPPPGGGIEMCAIYPNLLYL